MPSIPDQDPPEYWIVVAEDDSSMIGYVRGAPLIQAKVIAEPSAEPGAERAERLWEINDAFGRTTTSGLDRCTEVVMRLLAEALGRYRSNLAVRTFH